MTERGSDETLEEFLARIGAEAEAAEAAADEDDGEPFPPHVKVSRPNRARSRVLEVPLNPDDFAAVEAIAERRGLPASTVAREQLLKMIHDDALSSDPHRGGKRRPTDAEYEALSESYAAEPPRADEVRRIEVRPDVPPPRE